MINYQIPFIRWLNMSKSRDKQDKFHTRISTSNIISTYFTGKFKAMFSGGQNGYQIGNQHESQTSQSYLTPVQKMQQHNNGTIMKRSTVGSRVQQSSSTLPSTSNKNVKRGSRSVVPVATLTEYGHGDEGNKQQLQLPPIKSTPASSSSSSSLYNGNPKVASHSPIVPVQAAPSSSSSSSAKPKVLCCDKCDGKHETNDCPHYKKKRDAHPDAQKNKMIGGQCSLLPHSVLKSARVVRQPGDGSCLFHSMSYGLNSGSASSLRAEICRFIASNPQLRISDTPLQDWVRWDSGGASVADYARTMSRGSWGGGIEMACCSHIKNCNVHVYERHGSAFKRISAFDHPVSPESKPVVRVLYGGGVHYDALLLS